MSDRQQHWSLCVAVEFHCALIHRISNNENVYGSIAPMSSIQAVS